MEISKIMDLYKAGQLPDDAGELVKMAQVVHLEGLKNMQVDPASLELPAIELATERMYLYFDILTAIKRKMWDLTLAAQ